MTFWGRANGVTENSNSLVNCSRYLEESLFVISGFNGGLNDAFALLECYAALIGSYQRFGTDRLSETTVTNYQSVLSNITEDQRPQRS